MDDFGTVGGYGSHHHGVTTKQVSVQPTENGWIVSVFNPSMGGPSEIEKLYKGLAKAIPAINEAGGRGAVRGMDEEMDSYKEGDEDREEKQKQKMAAVQKQVEDAFKTPPSIHKPVETYVFLELDKMMKFLREVLVIETPPPEEALGTAPPPPVVPEGT